MVALILALEPPLFVPLSLIVSPAILFSLTLFVELTVPVLATREDTLLTPDLTVLEPDISLPI